VATTRATWLVGVIVAVSVASGVLIEVHAEIKHAMDKTNGAINWELGV
jgi:hypothetical protein